MGMPGAGKSEAVEVARERGAQVLRMGDTVWEEVRRRELPMEASVVGRVADEMRRSHGPDVWARRTLEAVDRGARLVVIDGLRSAAELGAFKAALGPTSSSCASTAPTRSATRASPHGGGRTTPRRAGRSRSATRASSDGAGRGPRDADVAIDNSGTVEELRSKVTALLERL